MVKKKIVPKRITRKLLLEIVDNLESVIYCHDEDGKFIYVGKKVKKFLSYDPEDLIGKDCKILIHKDDQAIIDLALSKIGQKIGPYNIRLVRKGDIEGKDVIFSQLRTRVYEEEGKPDLVYGYCLPIDIHKEIRSTFAQMAHDATFIYDDSFKFIFVNKKFYETFDCNDSDQKEKYIWEFFEDMKTVENNAKNRLAGIQVDPVYTTVALRLCSEEIFDVELSVLKVDLYGKPYVIGSARPFSAQRMREKTFAELNKLSIERIRFDVLFSQMLDVVCSIIRSDYASFWILSGDGKTYVMRACKGFKDDFISINSSLKNLEAQIIQQELKIEPIENDRTLNSSSYPKDCKYLLKIPLYDKEKNLIAIIFTYPTVKMRKEDLKAKYSYFAPQLISIIEQTTTYMKNWIFTRLYEIGGIQTGEMNKFLGKIINDIILNMLNVQSCSILAIDEFDFRRRIHLKASNPPVTYRNPNVKHYEKGQGLTGKAWESGAIIISSNVKKEKQFAGLIKENIPEMKTGIYVPISNTSGETVGVIRCFNLVSCLGDEVIIPFSGYEKEILGTIARIIGYILEVSLIEQRRLLMLSQLGHEVDSPLVSVRNDARFIHDHLDSMDINMRDLKFQDIDDNCNLLLMITDRVRFIHSEPDLQIEQVPIFGEVIFKEINLVRNLLRERTYSRDNIIISNQSKWAIPYLYIDSSMFRQVFYNLLINAIKYSRKKMPADFRIEVTARVDNKNYIIEVSDYGIGVEEEFREKIFEEFFRTPEAIKHDDVGSGLGLSIIRRLLAYHYCRIELTHFKNPTTFTITMPEKLKMKDWWR